MSKLFNGNPNAKYLVFDHLTTKARGAECVKDSKTIAEAIAYRESLPVEMLLEYTVTEAV
jgi:hypothetical protein